MRRPLTVLAVMTLAVVSCTRAEPPADPAAPPTASAPSWRLAKPFPLTPFDAIDLEGRDVSTSTWKGRVVVVNVWATWCAPCRREMPALAALQEKYRNRLLIVGLLQDNVTDAFAREFGKSVKLNYPIVRSTHEIESRFPTVLALPMTFVVDADLNLVAMFGGEVDPAHVESEIRNLPPIR